MADPISALGAAAAALQLVELGGKIMKFTYDLYAKLQKAPGQTQNQITQIEQLMKISGLIAKNQALQGDSIASVLATCLKYMQEFQRLLGTVSTEEGDKWLKRKRKAFEAVMKEKDVMQLFANIEREKSSLALCIAEIDSSLLRSIGIDIDDLKKTFWGVSMGVETISENVSEVKTILLTMNQRASETGLTKAVPRSLYLVPNRRARNFIGREDILTTIESVFSSDPGPHVVVLRGLGGQGKTQISLEYCRRTREKKFRGIFWVNANSESTAEKSFQTIVEKIKAPEETVPESATVNYVLDRLREWPDPWLMVFDNYDDVENFENVQDFMPDGEHGCILVTSRHSDSMSLATESDNAIDLPGLAESEALELLFKLSGVKETEASIPHCQAIVQRLSYHPLAIAQAGSYIKKRQVPLDQFMDELNCRKREILDHTPQLSQYRRTLDASQRETSLNVFTTWELSFEQLLRASSGRHKASLLTLFAFFDCNDISEHLFSAYCKKAQQDPEYCLWPVPYLEICLNSENGWNRDEFSDILIDLFSLSLLQSWSRGEDGFCHCSLHPLVQDWIRLRTGPEDLRNSIHISAKVLEAILDEFRDGGGGLST